MDHEMVKAMDALMANDEEEAVRWLRALAPVEQRALRNACDEMVTIINASVD